MRREIFKAADGKNISLAVWDEVASPKAVLQISHGMSEHILRYHDFAVFMNSEGFIVAGDDHRGHGETDPGTLGKPENINVFEDTANDLIGITEYLKNKYSLPVILLGHSYGSFLAQRYIMLNSANVEGVILSGSAFREGLDVKFGAFLAGRKVKKGKGNENGSFYEKLTFKAYDKKLKEGVNAWVTRDKDIVKYYNESPVCGFPCSQAFYYSLFNGFKTIGNDDGFSSADKSLKLIILSGADDGVGNYGKTVTKLYERFLKRGFKPQLKMYANARHEILNETNRQEVYEDISAFCKNCIAKQDNK